MKRYTKELRNEIIQLHLKEGRTIKSLSKEYHWGSGTLQYWLKQLRKECQNNPYIEEVALSFEKSIKLILENHELRRKMNS